MSQENVELAHRAHDAFNRRDLDGFLAPASLEACMFRRGYLGGFVKMRLGFPRHPLPPCRGVWLDLWGTVSEVECFS